MPTVQELLVDVFVATTAVSGRKLSGDRETVMIFLLLPRGGLMAIEAVHTLLGVHAHLVFVNDRVLRSRMALGAFSGGADQVRGGLFGFDLRTRAIDQESGEDKGKGDDYGEEH